MKKTLIPLILVASLSGCSALSESATQAFYNGRDYQTAALDNAITKLAYRKLDANPITDNANLTVISYDRRVLLAGQVKTAQVKKLAYDIVHKVPQVDKIYNQIEVTDKRTFISNLDDNFITAKAEAAMAPNKHFNAHRIKIITVNGVMYLMGKVTKDQAQKADDIAKNITGVQKVVNVFEIVTPKKS